MKCILLLAAALLWPAYARSEQRGVTIFKDQLGKEVGLYQESHALVIGVSDYTSGWPDLESVPGDIESVEEALQKQGFSVVKHLNTDSFQLQQAFQDFINAYGFNPQNRLLFYFSGHGDTRKEGRKGYLVPSDAPLPARDEKGFLKKALPMSQIMAWARRIEAKHALFLFDSCFSGTVFKQRALPERPPHISRLTADPVRQFITAGSAGETVPANSVFTPALIDSLEHGLADLDKDGYITGTELGVYLQGKVPLHTNQTPQFGKITDYELSRGDFVFTLTSAIPPKVVTDDEALPHQEMPTTIGVGDKVLAMWRGEGCLHPATVLEIKAGKYLVGYEFSDEEWLPEDHLFGKELPMNLKSFPRVYVALDSGTKWAPGRITDRKGDQFLVRLDESYSCRGQQYHRWAPSDMLIFRK